MSLRRVQRSYQIIKLWHLSCPRLVDGITMSTRVVVVVGCKSFDGG
jgi:hypothetical protein